MKIARIEKILCELRKISKKYLYKKNKNYFLDFKNFIKMKVKNLINFKICSNLLFIAKNIVKFRKSDQNC